MKKICFCCIIYQLHAGVGTGDVQQEEEQEVCFFERIFEAEATIFAQFKLYSN
jgi:hypothetical protein